MLPTSKHVKSDTSGASVLRHGESLCLFEVMGERSQKAKLSIGS